jgi:L-threonylcarbamoyladenylate synthase
LITKNIELAIQELIEDNIVAIPTETVYGLAGNALSESAVHKIFELKNRPLYNPLIVHIQSIDYLTQVAKDIPDKAYQLAKAFWPGPLTLVLNKKDTIPDVVSAQKNTVAVRVPNHPLLLALLANLDFPIAAPSANPFGSISPTSAMHVADYFGNDLEIILDGGECEKGIESTIVGFDGDDAVLYRMGSISIEDIKKEIGELKLITKNDINPEAPGMLSRHYAPKTKMYFTNHVYEFIQNFNNKKIGVLLFEKNLSHQQIKHQEILSETGNLNEAAKNLYAAMHRLDHSNLDIIVAERLPDIGLGKTINDKLERASKKE